MKSLLIYVCALASTVPAWALPAAVFDVRTQGAMGDGTTLDTGALQKSIDACHAAGGGVVYFPTGIFLTGSLILRSNLTLHLSPGAVLLGSGTLTDYPVASPRPTSRDDPSHPSPPHPELNGRHLLYAYGAENIAIEGGGVIDGHGSAFFDRDQKPLPRPGPMLEFQSCRRLRIENITIRNAPAWTLRPKNCDDVKIRGISLLNSLRAINSDGIDVDSSSNVIISDSHIESGDDCIVLKTTLQDGSALPVENVVVSNCVLVSSASAIKLGTESHADFRHCLFSHCVIHDSRTGIALLAKDGGTMEDIRFDAIAMTTRPKWGQGVEWPIVVDIERRTAESRMSRIRDVAFSGMTIQTKGRIMVSGKPTSPVQNVTFRDVTLRFTGYEEIKDAPKLSGGGGRFDDGIPTYAEAPAALILVNVDGIAFDGLRTFWPETAGPVSRHTIFGVEVTSLQLSGVTSPGRPGALKEIQITPEPKAR